MERADLSHLHKRLQAGQLEKLEESVCVNCRAHRKIVLSRETQSLGNVVWQTQHLSLPSTVRCRIRVLGCARWLGPLSIP